MIVINVKSFLCIKIISVTLATENNLIYAKKSLAYIFSSFFKKTFDKLKAPIIKYVRSKRDKHVWIIISGSD